MHPYGGYHAAIPEVEVVFMRDESRSRAARRVGPALPGTAPVRPRVEMVAMYMAVPVRTYTSVEQGLPLECGRL